jgi:preflagellin peptidase FlaK
MADSIDIRLILDVTRLIIGILILSYASYTDIKTRRASNILWIVLASVGGMLLLVQYLTNTFPENTIFHLIFIPIMIVLVYVMFQLRLIFGGADAKAIMALAILLPIRPEIMGFPIWESRLPYAWAPFFNALLIFLLIPIGLFVFNIVKKSFKFPHCFLGYKMSIQKARENFVWPMEKIMDGKTKFVYMPKDFDIEEELNEFEKNNIDEIWVTPKIPFMIPLLAGFICAFIFGDILSQIMSLF